MSVTIRLADPKDAPALRMLNRAFNGVDMPEETIRCALQAGGEIVVIAEAGGEAAGFCCAQIHRSFCYSEPVAELTEMYVEKAYRRRGCASAMLRFLEAHLKEAYGADECHLLTGRANFAAQAAYAAYGYRVEDEMYLTKAL